MTNDFDQFRDWDAAYVLGMLSPDDRRVYERHLTTCPSCTSAVAELAGLPGILSVLTPDEAVALEKVTNVDHVLATELVPRLASSVLRSRRLSRVRMAATFALAAAIAVGGIFVGTVILPNASVDSNTASQSSAGNSSEKAMVKVAPGALTAQLAVSRKGWGTRFDWTCTYPEGAWDKDGATPSYDLVVTTSSGKQIVVATWTATPGTTKDLAASTGTQASDIRSVAIRHSGASEDLVRTNL
jgi:hypothetical protein